MSTHESLDEKASEIKSSGKDVTVSEHPASMHHLAFRRQEVDEAAQLVAGGEVHLDAAEALRIRRKIDWHIMPMMCSVYSLNLPGTVPAECC